MRSSSLVASLLVLACTTMSQAALIEVGSHDLLPDTPLQSVSIYATAEASELVTGFNLRMRIGDGHPDVGGGDLPEPVLQDVDFSGGVWDAFPFTVVGGPVVGYPMYAQASVLFNDSGQSISPNGLVATLIVDTTGFAGGSFSLDLFDILEIGEDSNFQGTGGTTIPIEIVNGQLNVVPEPSAFTIFFLGGSAMAGGIFWVRRRRRS
ncbi:MAG: PEP-CTERM sorting domain-containing protein [Pirellulaceae bacterium]